MKAYVVLKGKHNTADQIMWIETVISKVPFKVHTVKEKDRATDYSGYKLKLLRKYATGNVVFIRKRA